MDDADGFRKILSQLSEINSKINKEIHYVCDCTPTTPITPPSSTTSSSVAFGETKMPFNYDENTGLLTLLLPTRKPIFDLGMDSNINTAYDFVGFIKKYSLVFNTYIDGIDRDLKLQVAENMQIERENMQLRWKVMQLSKEIDDLKEDIIKVKDMYDILKGAYIDIRDHHFAKQQPTSTISYEYIDTITLGEK
jgi:hypothetical protein